MWWDADSNRLKPTRFLVIVTRSFCHTFVLGSVQFYEKQQRLCFHRNEYTYAVSWLPLTLVNCSQTAEKKVTVCYVIVLSVPSYLRYMWKVDNSACTNCTELGRFHETVKILLTEILEDLTKPHYVLLFS